MLSGSTGDRSAACAGACIGWKQAGVRIDLGVLDGLSKRFALELERVGGRIFELAGRRFNINSPKQLGRGAVHTVGAAGSGGAREGQEPFRRRRMCWRPGGEA